MKLGANHELLAQSFACCDEIFVYANADVKWDVKSLESQSTKPLHVIENFDELLDKICQSANEPCSILVMSNGGFNGIHQKLLDKLLSK